MRRTSLSDSSTDSSSEIVPLSAFSLRASKSEMRRLMRSAAASGADCLQVRGQRRVVVDDALRGFVLRSRLLLLTPGPRSDSAPDGYYGDDSEANDHILVLHAVAHRRGHRVFAIANRAGDFLDVRRDVFAVAHRCGAERRELAGRQTLGDVSGT